MRIHLVTLGLFCLFTAFLTGCNTVEGIGKDMQAGGQGIQKAVKES